VLSPTGWARQPHPAFQQVPNIDHVTLGCPHEVGIEIGVLNGSLRQDLQVHLSRWICPHSCGLRRIHGKIDIHRPAVVRNREEDVVVAILVKAAACPAAEQVKACPRRQNAARHSRTADRTAISSACSSIDPFPRCRRTKHAMDGRKGPGFLAFPIPLAVGSMAEVGGARLPCLGQPDKRARSSLRRGLPRVRRRLGGGLRAPIAAALPMLVDLARGGGFLPLHKDRAYRRG